MTGVCSVPAFSKLCFRSRKLFPGQLLLSAILQKALLILKNKRGINTENTGSIRRHSLQRTGLWIYSDLLQQGSRFECHSFIPSFLQDSMYQCPSVLSSGSRDLSETPGLPRETCGQRRRGTGGQTNVRCRDGHEWGGRETLG